MEALVRIYVLSGTGHVRGESDFTTHIQVDSVYDALSCMDRLRAYGYNKVSFRKDGQSYLG